MFAYNKSIYFTSAEALTATELKKIFSVNRLLLLHQENITIFLKMEADMVSETLGFCPQLTQFVA
jgi:hypothetical protein